MLSTKREKKKSIEPGASQNRINEGTHLKGDITSTGYFRIDGHIEGNVTTPAKVVIGKTGVIEGSLRCEDADIEGSVKGIVEISGTLMLRSSAVIDGDITIGKLAVEPGATMNVNCVMITDAPSKSEVVQKKSSSKKRREMIPSEVT